MFCADCIYKIASLTPAGKRYGFSTYHYPTLEEPKQVNDQTAEVALWVIPDAVTISGGKAVCARHVAGAMTDRETMFSTLYWHERYDAGN